ncbi:MAG: DinB family protein [Janthinobacterium lividum]
METTALESELRTQLKALLDGGQAHATFRDAVADLPLNLQGRTPTGLPYSPWQLLEHMRIAQRDILDFSSNEDGQYKPMKWPDSYWPKSPEPPAQDAWERSVEAIESDRAAFEQLLQARDLTVPFPWGDGQNLLRQALLIADHESYHVGELIVTRRLLGAWKPKAGHA